MDKDTQKYISDIAHQIRNPLATIREGISLVLDGIAGKINEDQAKILKTTINNVDKLSKIISDLTDATKTESSK